MRNQIRSITPGLLLSTVALIVCGCSPQVPTSPAVAATSASFSDPFTYCAAVGDVDKPDSRYAGEPVPDSIVNGFKQAAGLSASAEPLDVFKKSTVWRCMGGKVYACNFGANLPCDSKADTNKTATAEMKDYCVSNPGSDFIPMSVTGHATIYSWHCVKDAPEVLEQIAQVDAAGYLASIWYEIPPRP